MLVVVAASDNQWNELTCSGVKIDWLRVEDAAEFILHKNAYAFFSLKDNKILPEFESLNKPIFVNSVLQTLAGLHAPSNVYRINGWAGFLKRTVWEIAGKPDEVIDSVFKALNIKTNFVKDEPGFIAARIIAMIINEAYFAVEDDVSSKAEIDTAMKLGTNYPYGPFEWASMIGTENILALLQKLYETEERYKPSQFLIKEKADNN
jgi:3-hydroxybutyryl-CoA dehydrogenase